MSDDASPMVVDLAREAAFTLGSIEVRPSTRELVVVDHRETLEPRVMRVLVALARRRGQVVSRNELVEVCWDGRAVSEDAINRSLSMIRRVSEAHGGFTITTVARVGYRLDEAAGTSVPPASPAEPSAPANATQTAMSNRPAIVVLPFANRSGDPDQELFTEGLVDEIYAAMALSRNNNAFNTVSNTALTFKGKDVSPQEAARQLGVRYVLEGSVRKAGDRVRISVTLTDAADGLQVWVDRFEDTLDDVFALQDKVARLVVGRMEKAMRVAETRRLAVRSTAGMSAYELLMRGRTLVRSVARSKVYEALDLFNQAAALAPGDYWPPAYAALCHYHICLYRWSDDPDADGSRAVASLRQTLLDHSGDAQVLGLCGLVFVSLGDQDEAVALADRSIALNPAGSNIWGESGWVRAIIGQRDLAVEHFETALRLDTVGEEPSWVGGLGFARFQQGRFNDAVALSKEHLQQTDHPFSYAVLAASYGHLGETRAAREAIARYRELTPVDIRDHAARFPPYVQALLVDGIDLAEGTPPADVPASA